MAENPREYIRAAQAAELKGDKSSAADLLHRAAAVYARSGSLSRALQLLRRARSLDGKRADIADAMQRLERGTRQPSEQAASEQDGELGEELARVPSSPEDFAEQQRLLEEALRAVDAGFGHEEGPRLWVVEELPPEELHTAVDWAVHSVPQLPPAKGEYEEVRLQLTPAANEQPPSDGAEPLPARAFEAHRFDRGPTRADPASDDWCSFCCRPRTEAGELVAGPAGAFICRACVGEADGLLGDVKPVPRPVPLRPASPEVKPAVLAQDEARALLEGALAAGVRRLLLLGPPGVGKTTWFQELQARGQGALLKAEALEPVPSADLLLVEDVDRLSPEAQAALAAFLARHPERTVLMSARGTLKAPGLVLSDGKARLPLHTTAALAEAVGGALPVGLLEQVQLVVPLRVPTKKDWVEVARHLLASRGLGGSVTAEVLTALAAEAARSPRAGHELVALLARLPAGSWKLDAAKKRKPARRSRRKGRT